MINIRALIFMSKTIKIIGIIIGLIFVLLIAGILLLPKLLNTDTFKQQITQQVEHYTGQKLTIEGDVKLSLFPWLSVDTGAISLSQPVGITSKLIPENKPLLQISSAKIGIKLFPLLQNKYELSKIELTQPQLYFITAKDGSTSLTGITSNKPANNSKGLPTAPKATTDTLPATDKASALGAIALSGISIINGELITEDQAKNTLHSLSQLNIDAGDILSLKPTPVKITAQVSINNNTDATNTANKNIETFSIDIQSQVSHSADLATLTLQQVLASISEVGNSASLRKLNATVDQLSFNQKTQALDIQKLNLTASDGKLSPQISIPAITLSLNDYATPIIAFNIEEKTLAFTARGEISVKDWDKDALFKGQINSEIFSPTKILNFLQIKYQPTDKNVLTTSKFSTEFNGSLHGFALHNINFLLDDSTLLGDASIINFINPQYIFDLNLNQINVDRYTPPSDKSDNKSSQQNAAAGLAIIAPFPLFKNIHANGIFRVTTLQVSGAKLSNIIVDIKSKDKTVIIRPKADLYDGKMDSTITYTDNGNTSTLRVENNLQDVNFGPLLKDTNVSDKISGKGTAKTDIVFIEKNAQQTNKGTIVVSVLDGALKDIDVKKILDDVQNKIDSFRGKAIKPETDSEAETRFAQMSATLNLNDNVITNDDLSIKAPAFRIGGKGQINLIPQTLDYATSVIVVNTNEGQGGKNRDDLKGLTIPVRFYGDINNPQYQIDVATLLKANAAQEIADKKDELRQKAAEKLGLIKKGDPATDNNSEISKEDLEKQLKEKAVEQLFKKLF
jgi:AsmA protein